ncbi:MAG: ComEC/Rec2 family competence protein [Ruthenibacterium sp.]
MKRPLAIVGFVYLLTQLLAAFVPPLACLLPAVFFMGCFAWLLYKKSKWARHCFVLSITIMMAVFLRAGYEHFVIAPMSQYHHTVHAVSGTVQSVRNSYIDGKVNAVVRVRSMDGRERFPSFSASAYLLPECTVGSEVDFTAEIDTVEHDSDRFYSYTKQIFVTLSDVTDFTLHGRRQTLPYQMRYLQEKSSAKIRSVLPREYGAVTCAMVLGDKSMLTSRIKDDFKHAGIVHILVVSGLHLSVFSGGIYAALRRFGIKFAAFCACVGVLCFMMFAGFTPSIVRAGVATLLVYGGRICNRQSDALTSLGAAALLLCLLNPYAAVDIGLLLSFSATLAVLGVSDWHNAYDAQHPEPSFWPWIRSRALFFFAIPLATTIATLPVLMAIGEGVSLLSVLCNCVAVPLLPLVLLFGFLIVLCADIAVLSPLFQLSGLVCGLCVKLFISISSWAAGIPGAFVYISGIVPLLWLLLCAALFFCGRVCGMTLRKNSMYCSLFFLLCVGIYCAFDAHVVRITLVGESENPAVVVTQNLKTAVVFRGNATQAEAVREYLLFRNRYKVDLWVDLRRGASAEYPLPTFPADKIIFAQRDLLHHHVLRPFQDVILTLYHQNKGNAAMIDVKDYTFCLADGTMDFDNRQGIEIYLAGKEKPQNLQCDILLLPRANTWEQQIDAKKYLAGNTSQLLIRGGKSVKLQGVTHDFE